jgi:cobalamin biosynthesis protein CobT
MLTVDDARDIIDIYGPHRKRWPPVEAAQMDALLKSDQELSDYLKTQQEIDQQLNSWQEDLDGAEIDDDEDGSSSPDEEEDEGDFDDEDNDEEEEDQDAQQSSDPADDETTEDRPRISLDPDDMPDMDELFSDTIRGLVEQDVRGQFNVFSRDRDGLVEVEVPDGTTTEAIDQAVQKAVGPLMKDLRRLIAARSQVRRIPGKRSGRLHAPSLHRVKLGDDRVFSRKEESPSLNTAITLLIDCSGSMGGSRLRLAIETAYALGKVLDKLNISFECIGFTDGNAGMSPEETQEWYEEAEKAAHQHPLGRVQPLEMPKFKSFDERWNIPTQKRFAANFQTRTISMGMTPEGCGLEFAAKRLIARKEDRKILICMTDGAPGCHDMNYSNEAECSDLTHSKRMVKSIEAAGIDLVGIGIQHHGPTGYYSNSMVIQSIDEMPKLLMGVLKKFIVG